MGRSFLKVTAALGAAALALMFAGLLVQMSSMRRAQERDAARIFLELESMAESRGEIERAVLALGRENNALRRALNLPEREYDFFSSAGGDEETDGDAGTGAAGAEDDLPFYLAVDTLLERQNELELAGLAGRVADAAAREARLSSLGVRAERRGRTALDFLHGERPLAALEFSDDGYELLSPGGDVLLDGAVGEFAGAGETEQENELLLPGGLAGRLEKLAEAEGRRKAGFDRAAASVRALHGDAEAAALRAERALRFTALESGADRTAFRVTTLDGIGLFSVEARYGQDTLLLDGEPVGDARDAFLELLAAADNRTADVRATDDGIAKVSSMASDEAFSAYLKQRGLALSETRREDNDYFYFDLVDAQGNRAGSLAVLKGIGEIYLMDGDDVVIGSLRSLGLISGREKAAQPFELPDDDALARMGTVGEEGKTILLCGTHENNADTIMVAHVAPGKATLIALPRDLWWKKRKINSYFSIYGPERFMDIVGEITGLAIDDYLVVDMYAFIDVINIIGGVQVTLDEPLIDPTYKVRENGEWKTLHYEKGTHLLDGIAALRVARSRHTSDDFDRARRQQLVISGIKERFDRMNAGEVKTVYELVQTLSAYVDTSFSPFELARLYLQNRDADLENGGVISTDNVLVATYSNLLANGKTEDEVDEEFEKGAWILVPKENNWMLIPWYVSRLIGGNA